MSQIKLEAFHCATDNLEQYHCNNCPSFTTYFLTHLTEHVENGHTTESSNVLKVYKCEHCGFKAHSKYIALRHNLLKCPALNNPNRWFHCKQCPTKYKSKTGLLAHVKSEHTFVRDDEWLHCYECGFRTIFDLTLKQHISSVHSTKPVLWFYCDRCNFKTKAKCTLKNHITFKHLPDDQVEWFQCEQCPSKYKTKYNLQVHIKNKHSDQKILWHYCDICNVRFKLKASLRKHMVDKHLPASELPQFQCKECSFKAFHRRVLKEHVVKKHLTEDQIQWFQCEKCPAKFIVKTSLSNHARNKHKEKLLQCKKCPYKTRNRDEFMGHGLIHAEERESSAASSLALEIRNKWKMKMCSNLSSLPGLAM